MTDTRLRNLDLGTLRSFVAIIDSGSMTRAATRLFMTQSAISMQIKRLEASLGLSVLERSTQGMAPTSEGEQLLHYARKMLALNDEAWGRLTSPDYQGQIRLGVPTDIIHPHIPAVLKAFSRDYPRVQIKLSTAITHTLREGFDNGLYDVVLTTEKQPRPGGTVISTQPLEWIGADNGSAWKKRPLPLGFSRRCAFRPAVIGALEKAGFDWVDMVASDDVMAGESMSMADLCLTAELKHSIHPTRIVVEHNGQLPELPEYSVVLYCTETTGDDQLAQALASYITHAYAQDH
uniref:LysR family transcriptional regulator n=1 Tax=uncultured Thiotrichaceae bacterium TaxID=298394 RepID=A0A6S6U6V5_9GAMM|nr:MAG: LysR family transcriptional regulator [uncultured Thiotrichaceae bacterium]